MYVWIGCKLPESFAWDIRRECLARNQKLELDTSGFTLPQHISLKISFDAGDRYSEILDSIEAVLAKERSFSVHPSAIEQAGGILWISFRENETLRCLHDVLDSSLLQAYGIGQHLFDKAFAFHSTLFSGDMERIAQMREQLADFPLPDSLEIDTFLLGLSEVGKSGTYRVVREITV